MSRHFVVPNAPQLPIRRAILAQTRPFVFNHFQDAPPATLFASRIYIVARGCIGIPSDPLNREKAPFPSSPLFSCGSALFCAMEHSQTLSYQLLAHSFARNGGGWVTGKSKGHHVTMHRALSEAPALRPQREIDLDGGVDFDGFAVQ